VFYNFRVSTYLLQRLERFTEAENFEGKSHAIRYCILYTMYRASVKPLMKKRWVSNKRNPAQGCNTPLNAKMKKVFKERFLAFAEKEGLGNKSASIRFCILFTLKGRK
jgi:hypothetical protein